MLSGLTAKDGYVKTLNLFYWDIGIVTPLLIVIFLLFEWIVEKISMRLKKHLQIKNPFTETFFYFQFQF